MRPTHKNRSRNRHRSSGGSSGNGGGNPLSRVYESNGPDVKVRGTAQTVAEKYLQLGRDAQSSGDIVMAESYFQHAEHYLRIVSAAQAYNQQGQPQQYRRQDEEFDDEETEDGADTAAEPRGQQQSPGEPDGLGDQPVLEAGERPVQQQGQDYRQPRDYRDNRDNRNRDSRDQGRDQNRDQARDQSRDQNRDRYSRPRWQDRRNEGQQGQGGESRSNQQPRNEEQPRAAEAQPAPAPVAAVPTVEESSQWEAPSFLRRPAPTPSTVAEEAPVTAPAAAAVADEAPAAPPPKRRYERKPRKEVQAEQPAAEQSPVTEPAAD
jgi:hypothetical protein